MGEIMEMSFRKKEKKREKEKLTQMSCYLEKL